MKSSTKWIALAVLLVGGLGAAAYKVVSNPENPIMKYFQGGITATDARIIIGPYPSEKDFPRLKSNGVVLIVSLLNPKLPYEKPMLEKEMANGAKNGIKVINFPMSPVMAMAGKNAGGNKEESDEAVSAIKNAKGRVYVHCYLGIHRVGILKKMLEKEGLLTAKYLIRKGERDDRVRRLDKAQADFNARDYKAVLAAYPDGKGLDPRERTLLAWAYLRIGDAAKAREEFSQVLKDSPGEADANNGLGYSALRENDLPAADEAFAAALASSPEDSSSLTGLGITRFRQGRMKDAAESLQKALEINPKNQDATEALGRIPDKYKQQ